MSPDVFPFFFVGIILLIVVSRFFAGGMDRDRVRQYIQERGGHLLDARWAPFGKGWYGEKNDRIYEIRYRDAQGNIREASCKTSMFSGVYLNDDRIVVPSATEKPSSLEEENKRLRAELARLKGENLS